MAYESYVLVCGGTACCSSGGTAVVEEFCFVTRQMMPSQYSDHGKMVMMNLKAVLYSKMAE